MVKPLYDSHVAVQDGDRVFAQGRPGTDLPTEEVDTKVKKFMVERDLDPAGILQDFARGRITYADRPGGQGYVRISGFPYLAYSKRARNDPADPTRHTRPQPARRGTRPSTGL